MKKVFVVLGLMYVVGLIVLFCVVFIHLVQFIATFPQTQVEDLCTFLSFCKWLNKFHKSISYKNFNGQIL